MGMPWLLGEFWCKCPMRKRLKRRNFWRVRRMKPRNLAELKRILPAGEVSFDKTILEDHAGDKWFAAHKPDAVVLARSAQTVAKVLRYACRRRIPVTARGGGQGYVGGCV